MKRKIASPGQDAKESTLRTTELPNKEINELNGKNMNDTIQETQTNKRNTKKELWTHPRNNGQNSGNFYPK